jgi:hypothetical protein
VNLVKFSKSIPVLLVVLVLPMACSAASSMNYTASVAPVAMVIDITGNVLLGSDKRHLKIFDELSEGDLVDVPASATLSLVYYRNGYRFDIRGYSRFVIKRETINVLIGMLPTRTRTPYRGRHRIRPGGLTQASAGMNFRPGTRSVSTPVYLEIAPVLVWARRRTGLFTLLDGRHKVLAKRRISAKRISVSSLPVRLERGRLYFWQLTGLGGGRQVGSGSFRIAGGDLLELAWRLRPSAGGSVADFVLYASWLRSHGLLAEARKYWQQIASRRGHMKRIRDLAE